MSAGLEKDAAHCECGSLLTKGASDGAAGQTAGWEGCPGPLLPAAVFDFALSAFKGGVLLLVQAVMQHL